MTTSDVPLFSMLRTRMRWHQDRQKVLAENVSNADTPRYRARDIRAPDFDQMTRSAGASSPTRTDARHIGIPAGSSGSATFRAHQTRGTVSTPDGNRVNLEDEMLKVAQNQMDYQAVVGLYQRSLGLIRTAIGKKTS